MSEPATLADLAPSIAAYEDRIRSGQHDEAWTWYRSRLSSPMLHRLGGYAAHLALLRKLLPADGPPRVSPEHVSHLVGHVALATHYAGAPGAAVELFRRALDLDAGLDARLVILPDLALALLATGHLREAERAARSQLADARWLYPGAAAERLRAAFEALDHEGNDRSAVEQEIATAHEVLDRSTGSILSHHFELRIGLEVLLLLAGVRGDSSRVRTCVDRLGEVLRHVSGGPSATDCRLVAQGLLWLGHHGAARSWAESGLSKVPEGSPRARAEVLRVRGAARLATGDVDAAGRDLGEALETARAIGYVEEALAATFAAAGVRLARGDHEGARALVEPSLAAAERGPYALLACDGYDLLTRVERAASRPDAAASAARRCEQLSRCDGGPHAYADGRRRALAHLRELGLAAPEAAPSSDGPGEPLPEVDLSPFPKR